MSFIFVKIGNSIRNKSIEVEIKAAERKHKVNTSQWPETPKGKMDI